ncbi:unnamed protein product [Caenorhabditis bovis]|uniref:SSD domain-containing protein n=1 Tax=Caenorhabditis bovis TaxID=2654633 RepID=A0A8S1F8E9_9PELO|nr:unnamed protein product [Caenorhabditis bovis]
MTDDGDRLVDRSTAVTRVPNRSHLRTKTEELLGSNSSVSLGFFFRWIGSFIGRFPVPFIITTGILLSCSFGMIGLKLRDNVRSGYTPTTSRSRIENQIYREFLHSEGDPVLTTLLIESRDGGSMHRQEYLDEAVKQWNYIAKNLSVTFDDGTSLKFSDVCGHYCDANLAVEHYANSLRMKNNFPSMSGYRLEFPIATIMSYKLHLERNFFGVKTNNNTENNIEHIQVINMMIMAEGKTLLDYERIGKWELAVFDYCQKYRNDDSKILNMHVIGPEIVDTEMNKDAQKMSPYFAVGIALMLTFVVSTVFFSALHYGFAGWPIIVVSICCVMVPCFAVTTTLGINNLVGKRTNSPMLIMPFLVTGIGVDDAFLTLHAWMRQPPDISRQEKLARVFHEVGPSITTTTLTNVITFLIGYFSPTEEMSIFCLGSAMALFFAYVYTLTFFSPLLALTMNHHFSKPRRSSKGYMRKFLKFYSKVISHWASFVFLMLGALVYWGFGIIGTINMEAKLDTAKILPLDTPIRKPNRLMEEYVWNEFYPVTVIVNHPLNITNATEMAIYDEFVNAFETASKSRGSQFSISWLRDYHEYFFETAAEFFDYDSEDVTNTSSSFNYEKLDGFLKSPVFKHHAGSMRLNFSDPIPVRSFLLTFAYAETASWDDRIELMKHWRQTADRYPQLNASVWNVNAMFVDQMLSLKPLAQQNVTVTLVCMAIVCAVFIQNPVSVVTATMSILSIANGVTGYLSFWALDLDPVSLCAILVSIGMAVDFVAHTTYHYQIAYKEKLIDGKLRKVLLNTPEARVEYVLANIAWPMLQGGTSTVLCIIPLVHLQNYLPLVFVKTITLVVIWGLFHGLVLLPAILSQIPLRFFNHDCNSLILGQSSNDDENYSSTIQEMTPLAPEPNV